MLNSAEMVGGRRVRDIFCGIVYLSMAAMGVAAPHVVNAGVPGESSREIAFRLGALLDEYKPQYVVIFAGMNDAVNDRKFLSPQQTAEAVTAMVVKAQTAHAKVILVTVHQPDDGRLLERHSPESYHGIPPEQRIQGVNRELSSISRDHKVPLADFYNALKKAGGPNSSLSTDGVHLTAKGYHLLAVTIRGAFAENIDPHATVLCVGDSLTYGIGVRKQGGAPEGDETYPAQLQSLLR
jgi:lysophospholipase L1-like esterase